MVGCDVGGTFTDLALFDSVENSIVTGKLLTTPDDPSRAVLDGLAALRADVPDYLADLEVLVHATTLVANAIIERRGARLALLCTAGHRDVLELRRHVRINTYELWNDPPPPLVPRRDRIPVDERVLGDGTIHRAVKEGEIVSIGKRLVADGVESVAVAYLNSYLNPANEVRTREILEGVLPNVPVTLSSDVLRRIREYERTSTAVLNAYVRPIAGRYLERLQDGLRTLGARCRFYLILSNGGIASAKTASEHAIRLVESGPIAGAVTAKAYSEMADIRHTLAFDMGGTTAKACLIVDGVLPVTTELEVARAERYQKGSGYPIGTPSIDVMEVGAGGGSIAALNQLGLLQVGPRSAGAFPGPACYGRGGTEPTVTDADLLLGYLDPGYFLGGQMRLSRAAAEGAVQALAAAARSEIESVAWLIHDVVNEQMAAPIRMYVAAQGGDLSRSTMIAYGGAGPVHAYNLAKRLGIGEVLVPPRAGVMSAVGLLVAEPVYDVTRTLRLSFDGFDPSALARAFEQMEHEVRAALMEMDPTSEVRCTRAVECSYIGQGHSVTLPLADAADQALDSRQIKDAFGKMYAKLYGQFYDDVPAGITAVRLSGKLVGGRPRLAVREKMPRKSLPKGKRRAYSPARGGYLRFTVFDRSGLGPHVSGPAIIEEPESTTVVDVGGELRRDAFGNLRITVS